MCIAKLAGGHLVEEARARCRASAAASRRRSCRRARSGSSPARRAGARCRATRAGIDVALVRAAPDRRDVAAHARRRPRAPGGRSPRRRRASRRSILFTFFLLCVSLALKKTAISAEARRERALEAARVRDERAEGDAGAAASSTPASSSASASCGIHLGETKLVISMRVRPASHERVDEAQLALDGDDRGLVLEAVARADLVDRHAVGDVGEEVDPSALSVRRCHGGAMVRGFGALRQHPPRLAPRGGGAPRIGGTFRAPPPDGPRGRNGREDA